MTIPNNLVPQVVALTELLDNTQDTISDLLNNPENLGLLDLAETQLSLVSHPLEQLSHHIDLNTPDVLRIYEELDTFTAILSKTIEVISHDTPS